MKRFLSVLLCLLVSFCLILPAAAEGTYTVTMTSSTSTVYLGSSVTVTLKFSGKNICGAQLTLSFDNDRLTYDSGACSMSNPAFTVQGPNIRLAPFDATAKASTLTVTLKFKAKALGDASVQLTNAELFDSDELSISGPASKTVKISVQEKNLSSDCALKSLTAPAECKLTPAFAPTVLNYTCTVPFTVTSFPLDWEAHDPDATVKAAGSVSLKVGENVRTVTVTAPNGAARTYTVTVTRQADTSTPAPSASADPSASPEPQLTVEVEGVPCVIQKTIDLPLPEGYTTELVNYEDTEVQMAVSGELTLAELSKGEETDLYLYREGTFQPFRPLTVVGGLYTVVAGDEENNTVLTLNEKDYPARTCDAMGEGYYILFVLRNDTGETYDAVYCEADGSLQKLSEKLIGGQTSGDVTVVTPAPTIAPTPAPTSESEEEEDPVSRVLTKYWLWIVIGLAVLLAAVVTLFIVAIVSGRKQPEDAYDVDLYEGEEKEDREIVVGDGSEDGDYDDFEDEADAEVGDEAEFEEDADEEELDDENAEEEPDEDENYDDPEE